MKKTAVVWSWRDDNDIWKPYDSKTNLKLEESFVNKEKKYDVDDERYIDFSCTANELAEALTFKITKDVIAIQRRNDDKNKRRAVKRYVPDFFDKEIVAILSLPKKEYNELKLTIETYGGIVSDKIGKKKQV